jgi:hypothetical protein
LLVCLVPLPEVEDCPFYVTCHTVTSMADSDLGLWEQLSRCLEQYLEWQVPRWETR